MDRPLVGVRAIIRKKNEVLLGLHEKGHAGGFWGFPGGHMEGGEFFEQCAKGRRSNDNSKSASLSPMPPRELREPHRPIGVRTESEILCFGRLGSRYEGTRRVGRLRCMNWPRSVFQ